MIVECSGCQSVPRTVLTLRGFKSYHSKYSLTIPLISTTIKEEDEAVILFILGTHEAATGTGTRFSHAPTPFRSRAVTTEVRQANPSMSTDECVHIHSHRESLPHIHVLSRKPQDTAVEPKPSADMTNDVPMETSTEPATTTAAAPVTRKRPRLDLNSEPRERKRGKTMFGLLVGTLNKAKTEDKQRSATDAVRSLVSYLFISHANRCTGKEEADDRAKAPG